MGKFYGTIMPRKRIEVQRNEILETLLRKIAELEDDNALLRHDLTRTAETRDEYMADADRGAIEITQLQSEIMTLLGKMGVEKPAQPIQEDDVFLNNTPFVVVLIDGSKSMLGDDHIQEGDDGGRKAVTKIYEHLMQHLTQRKVFQSHWRLIIKFYASMSNLGTTYLKSDVIDDLGTWRGFINGFNEAYPLCYFIDAGDDQIKAEQKIQDQLELFFGHRDCQHTVLVGSEDGSYTGFLRQYMKSDDLCGRITVVEAIPFPGEFFDLSSRFLPPRKDGLFPPPPEALTLHNLPAGPKRSVSSPVRPTPNTINKSPPPGPTPSPKKIFDAAASRLQPLSLQSQPQPQMPSQLRSNHKSEPQSQPHPQTQLQAQPTNLPPPTPRSISIPSQLLPNPTRKPFTTPDQHPRVALAPTPRSSEQTIRRKPLADTQTRLPRPRNTFFNSKGQRVDSGAYVSMYTQRYLQC